jgi:copper(I)-binding protein
MKKFRTRAVVFALAAWVAATTGARAAGPVAISDAWSNPASAGGSVHVYATITNNGDEADRLIGAVSPSATGFELHDLGMKPGATPPAALVIPPHATVTFAPGGDDVTYTGVKTDIAAGGLFFARLHFERAGWVVTIVRVRDAATPSVRVPTPLPGASSVPVIPVPVIQH